MIRKNFVLLLGIMLLSGQIALGAYEDYDTGRYRTNGPPDYRYSRSSSQNKSALGIDSDDANEYWGDRYHGNEEPDPNESYRLDREIYRLERSKEEGNKSSK